MQSLYLWKKNLEKNYFAILKKKLPYLLNDQDKNFQRTAD